MFTWDYWKHIGKFGGIGFVAAVVGLSTAACLIPTSLMTNYFEKKWQRRHEQKANEPMGLTTIPAGLLAFRLRSRLGCQDQVVAGHRGRSLK